MLSFDVRNFDDATREAMAARVKVSSDFNLPHLDVWNYAPCREHKNGWVETFYDEAQQQDRSRTIYDRPKPGCRRCGIIFRQHQRVGIAWMYLKKRGLLADTMGTGKSLAVSEPVLTPSGWVPIGDLREGDLVISPEGTRVPVLGVYPQGKLRSYRVTFSDGTSVLASADHLWTVRAMSRNSDQKWETMTTKQIQRRGVVYLPYVSPSDLGGGPLPLDPYLLGLLLGDGGLTGHSPMFTTADPELIDSISGMLPEDMHVVPSLSKDRCPSYRLVSRQGKPRNPLKQILEDIGAWGKTARFKSVPEQFLFSTVENRWAILQGLMDTDGSADLRQGYLEFGSSSQKLAEDVAFLVRSLGGRARISHRPKTDSYRVSIGNLVDPPFRLSRKVSRFRPSTWPRAKSIVSVKEEGVAEMVCISVGSESKLFLTSGVTPTHNTSHAAGLIAMLYQTGEIPSVGRAIIIPRAPALGQWQAELLRMIPGLNLIVASGTRKQRMELYSQPWDVLLVSPQTFNNDQEILRHNFKFSLLVTDDVDAIRNRETDTARNIKKLGYEADRMFIMTGTPLQKKLSELWSTLEPVGGREAFGTLESFERRHVTTTTVREFDERTGLQTKIRTVPAYRNMVEVKEKMAPMVLRRKVEDLKDVSLPEVNVNDVFLDLYPAQRNKYEELRKGVLRIIKEQGDEVKHITALTQIHYGAQICGGLATLGEPDGPNTSVKMDWVMEALQGSLEGEKVVIFANYKNTVRTLHDRFRSAQIGFETVWGEERNREARMRSQDRFWDDPSCRVLIGTQAIEQSLNLQVSRHLVNLDMIMNPSRMEQLAGRIRRDGSAHKHVYVHNLLTVNTQEARYLPLLEREAALSSFVWDENNELFNSLPPLTLLQLITG